MTRGVVIRPYSIRLFPHEPQKAEVSAAGLTDAEIDAELDAYNAECRS